MHIPIRCCCQPVKILGYLNLPRSVVRTGPVQLLNLQGQKQTIELRVFVKNQEEQETAIYSEERPKEFWQNFNPYSEELPKCLDIV